MKRLSPVGPTLRRQPPEFPRGSRRGARLRVRLTLALLRVALWATRVVRRATAERLCRVAGWCWWLGAPAARSAVTANLRQILGHAPSRAMVREVFFHGALNYWDILALPQLSPVEVGELVESTGWEHVDRALERGKGVVMVTAHLSSVSLGSQLIALHGYPVTAVLEPIDPPEVYELLARLRETHGVRFRPLGPQAAREVLAALRANQVAGLVSDRDVLGTGPSINFFGAPTSFPDGAAVLSLRTGAAVIPAIVWRRPDGRFQGVVGPPVEALRTGSTREDTRALLEAIARRLEYHVAAHPEQWTVFQRRWPDTGV